MAGKQRVHHSKWRFIVEIPRVATIKFKKVSEVKFKVEKEEIREGGMALPKKTPGFGSVEDVTLDHGATSNVEDLNWFREVLNFVDGRTLLDDAYKRDISIVQLDLQGNETLRHTLLGAFPIELNLGDWDNDAAEKVVRQMVLTYDLPKTS